MKVVSPAGLFVVNVIGTEVSSIMGDGVNILREGLGVVCLGIAIFSLRGGCNQSERRW